MSMTSVLVLVLSAVSMHLRLERMENQILLSQATIRLHAQMLEELVTSNRELQTTFYEQRIGDLEKKIQPNQQRIEDLHAVTEHWKTTSGDHGQKISDLQKSSQSHGDSVQKLHTKIESHDEKVGNCEKKVEGLELSMKNHQRETRYDLDSLNRSYDSLARAVNITGSLCCDRPDA